MNNSNPDNIVELPAPQSDQTPSISSEDAERALLGGLMLENETYGDVADIIDTEDFFYHKHRVIFDGLCTLLGGGQNCDNVSLAQHLNSLGGDHLVRAGGTNYLGNLLLATPSSANVSTYAKIIHGLAMRRAMIRAGRKIVQRALQPGGRNAEDLLQNAERDIFALGESLYRDDINAMKIDFPKTVDHLRDMEHRFGNTDAKNPVTGVPTGLSELNRLTAGLQNSDLFVIAAGSSLGKTSLALHIACQYARERDDRSVLFCSMEMPAIQLATRLLSTQARIPHNDLRVGRIATAERPDGWRQINAAIETLKNAHLLVDDSNSLTPQRIRSRARRVARAEERAGRKLGLIVVDYLQLVHVPQTGRREVNRTTEIGMISSSLKALARELNIPVVALSQLNRQHERRASGHLLLSDLRDSGSIEQDADVVCFISLPENVNPADRHNTKKRQIYIAKQRNGPTGKFEVLFDGEIYLFADLPEGYTEEPKDFQGIEGSVDYGDPSPSHARNPNRKAPPQSQSAKRDSADWNSPSKPNGRGFDIP